MDFMAEFSLVLRGSADREFINSLEDPNKMLWIYIDLGRTILNNCKKTEQTASSTETILSNLNLLKQTIESKHNKISTELSNIDLDVDPQFRELRLGLGAIRSELTTLSSSLLKSSVKGKIVEDTLTQKLIESFPSFDIINTAKIKGATDIQIKTDKSLNFLVEVKTYKSNVPSKEVLKFYRDINLNKPVAAFMASVTSGIVGKHNMEYEILNHDNTNSTTIVCFVHNIGLEAPGLICAINFVLEVIKMKQNVKQDTIIVDTKDLQDLWNNVNDSVQDLQTFIKEFNKTRNLLDELRSSFNKQVDNLSSNVGSLRLRLENVIDKIKETVLDKYVDSCAPEQLKNWTKLKHSKCKEFLRELQNTNDQRFGIYDEIYRIIRDYGCEIHFDNTKVTTLLVPWNIIRKRDFKKICTIKATSANRIKLYNNDINGTFGIGQLLELKRFIKMLLKQ